MDRARRLPIGVERTGDHLHARVWAPAWQAVALVVDGREAPLAAARDGYFEALVADVPRNARYGFRLGDKVHADPVSRYQPEGPFGLSQLVDDPFAWTDAQWTGIPPDQHVFYELHVGTFTPAGTWAAAAEQLPYLAALGVTTIEVMPVAEFAGTRGWGYDGVNLFAPSRLYGTPNDMRAFVDRAHGLGLGVILDVVYNHFGPAGNPYFTYAPQIRGAATEWGEGLDFTHLGLREMLVANAGYWIDEFHLDGLRLDATQEIPDRALIGEIGRRARACGKHRHVVVTAENEPQDARLLAEHDVDAMWNDDFHHTARVALTGNGEGYLHDYHGSAQELVAALTRNFLYQGQLYPWHGRSRGHGARAIPHVQFVHYLENHDQVANVGLGERLAELADPASVRAMTAVLLLGPQLPLLFQGQETGCRRRWYYFADHAGDLAAEAGTDDVGEARSSRLADAVRAGRAGFVSQFAPLATPAAQAALPDPGALATFRACVLDPAERRLDAPLVRLHRDLIALRRTLTGPLEAAPLTERAFVVRYEHGNRLLLVNLGPTLRLAAVPEPLIAPPACTAWVIAWSSEHPSYGGHGTPSPFSAEGLHLPARSAVLVRPEPDA